MSKVESATPHGVRLFPDGRMNVHNAALYLGLAPKTLAAMRCQGRGPKFIKRGRIFYFKEDLDAWLIEGGRRSSTAQNMARLGTAGQKAGATCCQ